MTVAPRVPRYEDLPPTDGFDGPNAWEVFGPDDDLGRLNLLTPDVRLAALQEVQRGVAFGVCLPVGQPDPPWVPGRKRLQHHLFGMPGRDWVQDDYLDNFYLQG